MDFIFSQVWILFIVITIANGLMWRYKSKHYINDNPELKEGYDKLIKGWLVYGNIPWAIIGIGMLTGLTKNIDEFFNPKVINPIVILFFISIIILWIIGSYWMFFKGGAELLVKHPGLFTQPEKGNEKFELMKIKLLWIAGIIGGIIGLIFMYKMNFPPVLH